MMRRTLEYKWAFVVSLTATFGNSAERCSERTRVRRNRL
jgi:hypothetical protein